MIALPEVRRMCGETAPRYDFLNRLLSAGLDDGWRKQLAKVLELGPGERVLDLACGTGDTTRFILK